MHILNLPKDIIYEIALQLSLKNINKLLLTCHSLHNVLRNDDFWKMIYKKKYTYPKIEHLNWKQMVTNYGFVIQSNLYNKKYTKCYKISPDIHNDFVYLYDCDLEKNFFVIGSYEKFCLYDYKDLLNESKSISFYHGEPCERIHRIQTKILDAYSSHTIQIQNDFIYLSSNKEPNIEFYKIDYGTQYISTNYKMILDTKNPVYTMSVGTNNIGVVNYNDDKIKIFDLEGNNMRSITVELDVSCIKSIGNKFFCGSRQGIIRMYDTNSKISCTEYKINADLFPLIRNIYYDEIKNLIIFNSRKQIFCIDARTNKCLFNHVVPKVTKMSGILSLRMYELDTIFKMQYANGMILWNYIDPSLEGYNLNIWKLTNNSTGYKEKKINHDFSAVSDFKLHNEKMFMWHDSDWTSITIRDFI